MKIRPVGAELFHAGGRTDMTEPIVAFRNFSNAPKNGVCGENKTGKIMERMVGGGGGGRAKEVGLVTGPPFGGYLLFFRQA